MRYIVVGYQAVFGSSSRDVKRKFSLLKEPYAQALSILLLSLSYVNDL